jgi:hypothetical protein
MTLENNTLIGLAKTSTIWRSTGAVGLIMSQFSHSVIWNMNYFDKTN